VTDYGVRLTVRVGILSPLACDPFMVVLLYTVSPLRGGRFHRPFQGFSAPRYVSTTGSTYRLPCNDMPCIDIPRTDMPRLGYTCRFHTFLGQVT
jgi:hypothetical protein